MTNRNVTLRNAPQLLEENLRLLQALQQIIMPMQRNQNELVGLHNHLADMVNDEDAPTKLDNYQEYERLHNNIWDLIGAFNKDTERYFKADNQIDRIALRYENLLYYYQGVVAQSKTIVEMLLNQENGGSSSELNIFKEIL